VLIFFVLCFSSVTASIFSRLHDGFNFVKHDGCNFLNLSKRDGFNFLSLSMMASIFSSNSDGFNCVMFVFFDYFMHLHLSMVAGGSIEV